MNIFLNIIGKLFGWNKQSAIHFERFMAPHMNRLLAIGVPVDQVKELAKIAVNLSHPEVMGLAPGSILRDMTDEIEAGRMSADEIIAKYG